VSDTTTSTMTTSQLKKKKPSFRVFVIRCLMIVYDVITFPVYYLLQQPWKVRQRTNRVRAQREDPEDLHSPYVRVGQKIYHPVTKCKTIPQAQRQSLIMNNRDQPCLGFRQILAEEQEKAPNGKLLRKWKLSDYQWLTISEVDQLIGDIARGLLINGVKPKDNVLMFAETRLEWFLCAQAILRIGGTIATLYASLGDEAIVFGINETEVTHIITTQDLLPKLSKVKTRIPKVNTVIYIEGIKPMTTNGFGPEITLVSYKQLLTDGKGAPATLTGVDPQPDDVAIILYTSGSTGNPKGVVLTHKNFMAAVSSVLTILDGAVINEAEKHRYLGYLPLAHSLEFVAETFMFSVGVRIGYGTTYTITDTGTAVRRGDKGDISHLKPTIMPAVPLILDRIRKTIEMTVEKRGRFSKELFKYIVDYKYFWERYGYQTPIINKLFCKPIRKSVGGELQFMIVGGAPLSPDTQKIMKAALNIKLLQGFGSTETSAATCIMDFDDLTLGRIGAPLHGVKAKLIDWEEGGYRVTDKPYPRGEMIVGGDTIALGYYKLDKETEEAFEVDEDGVRWFKMGDIAEVDERGTFKIIDRKKDLVKLQFGEYISLGKVESELKCCRYVENICVYGDSFHTNLVAIVVPNAKNVRNLAEELGVEIDDQKRYYDNERLVSQLIKELTEFGLKSGLNKTEIPTAIKVCAEEWTPANGLITAALKLKRKAIQNYYQKDIDRLYGKLPNHNNNHI